VIIDEDVLLHYGTPRHSGRYPWGSGGEENQGNKSFLDHIEALRKKGLKETEIAEGLGLTTTELRAQKSIAKNEQKQANIRQAQALKDNGNSTRAISERMGIPESTVRALLKPGEKDKADLLQTTANMLQDQVDKKGFIDVGTGVENDVGVSRTRLDTAIAILTEKGYALHKVQEDQPGTNFKTIIKVLAPPGTTYVDIVTNKDKIRSIQEFSQDGGRSFTKLQPPLSINAKRVAVRYAEDGGKEADGVIYVRPGVDDISLGGSRYAQVRIAVNDTHYLKGMAMYKEDLPKGVDLMFNTVKSDTGNKLDAMKSLKDDPDMPFGSLIKRQIIDKDPATGVERVTSVMNIVNEEGDWNKWSRSISSQVLSKQSPALAKTQLDMTFERRQQEYDGIMALTNPVVKKMLLEKFADSTDAASVHLKAAALPRQASHVILPIDSLKETEVYAPNYRNGEQVVLIRHPHGGKFEIPELTVNNRHPEAKAIIGPQATDAIGINSKVAQRLSGADFDGDSVLVIPNSHKAIQTAPALLGLKDFDPSSAYPKYEGMAVMTEPMKEQHMGQVSNLITDMTIRGASHEELARALRHSMVVIDAAKHELNYKESAKVNNIVDLKKKYQSTEGQAGLGASTIVSRAKSRIEVPERRLRVNIDPETGRKIYLETGRSYVDAKGRTVLRTQRSKKLAEVEDAHQLSSGTRIEEVYANHSNKLKALANQARKESLHVESRPYSPSAKAAYATEVASLDASLNKALKNRPRERQALLLANTVISAKRQANPNMEATELKKVKAQALTEARLRTGAHKDKIVLTDAEWKAIQAGAISTNKLTQILANADLDRVKELATPRSVTMMTPIKLRSAQAKLAMGYTQAEVADDLGVSLTTLKTSLKG